MYQIAKDFRLPSRSADRSIAGLCDCRRDVGGGRKDQRDGAWFDRNRLSPGIGDWREIDGLDRGRLIILIIEIGPRPEAGTKTGSVGRLRALAAAPDRDVDDLLPWPSA